MSIRHYIGIDPGTKCGWAVLTDQGARLASGTWDLSRSRHDGAGMTFVRFERLFRELLSSYPDAVVGFEQQVNRFPGSAHIGAGIMAHIERVCEEVRTPYSGVSYSTVKKAATGKGNAKKEAIVACARERFGRVGDDNEADALFVALVMREGRE